MNSESGRRPEDMKAELLLREVASQQKLHKLVRRRGTLFHSASWFVGIGIILAWGFLLLWQSSRFKEHGLAASSWLVFGFGALSITSSWIEEVHRRIDALVQWLDTRGLLDK